MNCLVEALGLHCQETEPSWPLIPTGLNCSERPASLIVELANRYYYDGDAGVLPRSVATRQAFINAMSLDIAMGGSTNTVLHLLAIDMKQAVDFAMKDIDALSRKIPNICKSPQVQNIMSRMLTGLAEFFQ